MAEAVYLDSPFGISVDFSWHPVYEDWTYTDYVWTPFGSMPTVRFRYEYTDPRPRDAAILMVDAGIWGQRTTGYYDGNLLQIWEDESKAHFEKEWDTLESFFLELGITPPESEQLVKVTLRLPIAYTLWFHRQTKPLLSPTWIRTDRYVIAEVSYLNVDNEAEFISVPAPPPLPPEPRFVTELCSVSKESASPTEPITVALTIENEVEDPGRIYIGILTDSRYGNWIVQAERDIGASARLTHSFSLTPQDFAGAAISESQYLSVDFCVGYVTESIYDYKPETIKDRWRVTLAVIVEGPPPDDGIPDDGIPDDGIKIPAWAWGIGAAVGTIAVGGIAYAATRRR